MAQVTWFSFVLSAVLIAATVNIATGILLTAVGNGWTFAILVVLTLGFVLFANLYQGQVKQRLEIEHTITRPHPRPRRGLIMMPTQPEPAMKAIEYHKSNLEHVWGIETPAMRSNANDLRDHIDRLNRDEKRSIKYHRLDLQDPYDADACYQLVLKVFEEDALNLGLLNNDVIADITGGTKVMTSAMALACADLDRAAQQVPAIRATTSDVSGNPVLALEPIELQINHHSR
jgi:hypothetical protein